jgi:hypothetical protein
MAITSDDPEPTTTAVVTIRIPCDTDSDLVTDAEDRLAWAEDVDTVTIDGLYGIAPKLSATAITIGITIRWITTTTDIEVKRRLAEVPGLESIARRG